MHHHEFIIFPYKSYESEVDIVTRGWVFPAAAPDEVAEGPSAVVAKRRKKMQKKQPPAATPKRDEGVEVTIESESFDDEVVTTRKGWKTKKKPKPRQDPKHVFSDE